MGEPDILPAVLCVDDDANILDGYRRFLRKKFRIHVAVGAARGLEAIELHGPFGVVISDYQMPGMNGAQFLSRVRTLSPETVRIMLTGQTDFSTALAAVNQAHIFRFLMKPCTPLILEKVLDAGFEQHRLLVGERQLTHQTLLGCVHIVADVLSTVQPASYGRATRVRRYVRHMAAGAGLAAAWELEAAAMLSQIGWITLPPELLAKAAKQELSEEDMPGFLTHASAAARIIERIPRLDVVARMIESQHAAFQNSAPPEGDEPDLRSAGAQMLKVAIDFDGLRRTGLTHADALERMRLQMGAYNPAYLDAMSSLAKLEASESKESIPVSALRTGMVLNDDLYGKNGLLLLAAGEEVTSALEQRFKNFGYGLPFDHLCTIRRSAY